MKRASGSDVCKGIYFAGPDPIRQKSAGAMSVGPVWDLKHRPRMRAPKSEARSLDP